MTTPDALLAAVLANPADDLPRLVLADWYEENGEAERATLIRTDDTGIRRKLLGRLFPAVMGGIPWPEPLKRTGRRGSRNNYMVHEDGETVTVFVRWQTVGPSAWPEFKFRHGHIEIVCCSLADWCGGECRLCRGQGRIRGDGDGGSDRWPCHHCHGTGRTPGIGSQIVAAHPVERVVLSGTVVDDSAALTRWHRITRGTVGPLWPFLDTIRRDYERFDYVEFASADEASDIVSKAALAWAKSQLACAHVTAYPIAVDITAGTLSVTMSDGSTYVPLDSP